MAQSGNGTFYFFDKRNGLMAAPAENFAFIKQDRQVGIFQRLVRAGGGIQQAGNIPFGMVNACHDCFYHSAAV